MRGHREHLDASVAPISTPLAMPRSYSGEQPKKLTLGASASFVNLVMTTFSTPSQDALFASGFPVYYLACWSMTLRLSHIHPWSLLAYIVFA